MIAAYAATLVIAGNERAGRLGVGTLLLNMLYLDNVTGVQSVVPVGWTLCLELQFYLLLAVLVWLAQKMASSIGRSVALTAVFIPGGLWSVAIAIGLAPLPMSGLFLTHWYLFLLGTGTGLVILGFRLPGWALSAAMFAAAFANLNQVGPVFAMSAAGLILFAHRRGLLAFLYRVGALRIPHAHARVS